MVSRNVTEKHVKKTYKRRINSGAIRKVIFRREMSKHTKKHLKGEKATAIT
jgi:hypothetical protein